ncbi:MAG: hypothetical protein ACI4UE_00905 [Candidatus Scatovivens sp.]
MINIINKKIDVEESLRKRLEIICDFCNTTPTIINGSIRKVDKTNLSYIEQHKIIINNKVFLVFNYSNEIYINNLIRKIKINELEKNQENLEKANKKSLELDNKLKEVKEIINDLKPTLIKKDNYILKQEDKDKIEKYINQVDKTNDEYKNIQTLSITLNNVDNQIQENQKEIQTLTENNEALQLRVDTLTRNNKVKDKQIKDLKEENLSLRQSLSFWKDKFLKVISFIRDKLFGKEKEREKYMDVTEDLY